MKKVLLLCGALLIAAPVYAAGSLTLNWTDNSNNINWDFITGDPSNSQLMLMGLGT
ncbi:hypothetical protein LCGC14_2647650 [marine sediment metagenome]|uniref:Uncharacterized protein n=1 Tax=marine sediment metagenome TaxID=412755 RepID=A0A0F8ZVS8_9ZZZZ